MIRGGLALIAPLLLGGTLPALPVPARAATGPAAPGSGLEEIERLGRMGRYADAEAAARVLLKETERRTGTESLETAEVLDQLAAALRRGGKVGTPEAREVCERALRIKERTVGTADPGFAASLYNLALLFAMRGEFDSAAVHLERTLRIRKEALGPDHPGVAQALVAIGSVEMSRGNYARSRAALEEAVRIQRAALDPADLDRAYGLNALGSLEYETGAPSLAIPLIEEAIGILERSATPNRPLLGNCEHNLGCAYSEIGDTDKALKTLRRALRLREESLGADHPNVASTLVAQGDVLLESGDTLRALSGYRRALRIDDRAYGADHPSTAWTCAKLGQLLLATGDVAGAGAMLRRAVDMGERLLGSDHPDLWLSLIGLAEVAAARGDADAARAHYERALRILEKAYGPSHIDLGFTLDRYARFLLGVRDSSAALDASMRAARVNEEQLRLIERGLAERQALLYASTRAPSLDVGLDVLAGARYREDPDRVREAWDALVRWRALVLDEVASRNRAVGDAEGLSDVARRLETARGRLANLLVRGPSDISPERYRSLTDATREEVERAERELGAKSASFRAGQDHGRIGWEEVLSALPGNSALLAFAQYGTLRNRAYLAFVLGDDRRPVAIPLGSSKRLDALVSRWEALVAAGPAASGKESPAALRSLRSAGEALRAVLWDPVAPYLRDAGRVFVVPDGSLHLVNLAALPVGASGYLVESGPLIHYLGAERDLAELPAGRKAGVGLLAMGGPSFDRLDGRSAEAPPESAERAEPGKNRSVPGGARSAAPDCDEFRSARFEPLPESKREVEAIDSLWNEPDRAVVLTGMRATERAFKELAPGRSVLHVATHAFFLNGRCGRATRAGAGGTRGIGGVSASPQQAASIARENPLRLSGIVLAGANLRASTPRGEEDGILTAEEIASLDLSGVRWAVLSACDTGAGEIRAGEGVLGLRRAFQAAGVATLIMSLWAVEDQSAGEWMKALYEARFREKRETDEAVREATLSVLRERRAQARSTHPFYWAGFVAAGDWR